MCSLHPAIFDRINKMCTIFLIFGHDKNTGGTIITVQQRGGDGAGRENTWCMHACEANYSTAVYRLEKS